MSSIALDLNPLSPNYLDLKIEGGTFVLVDGTDEILQNVLQDLRMFLEEWYLDITQGTPWFQQILVSNVKKSEVDAILINKITSAAGIDSLLSYSSTIDSVKRTMTVKFKAQSTKGIINYSGTVL